MKIIIGGDVSPNENNIEYFVNGQVDKILDKEIIDMWKKADFRVLNFESTFGIKENSNPIYKLGPNLMVQNECINGIKNLNPDIALLANNHILDYGVTALDNTISLLENNGIKTSGIIENINTPMLPIIIEKDGIKVGIYNFCDNEFSIATSNHKGANPLRTTKTFDEIANAKKICDYLIVVYHGGKEFYRYPSPKLKELCHHIIDIGADMVIVQHSHCIGCDEKYNGKTILYGQGNFIFDNGDDEYWNSELLVEINVEKDMFEPNYIFLEKSNHFITISNNSQVKQDFINRSNNCTDDIFLKNEYKKFALDNLDLYLFLINRPTLKNRLLFKIFKRKFFTKVYKKKDYVAILDFIECNAHRELLSEALKSIIEENNE